MLKKALVHNGFWLQDLLHNLSSNVDNAERGMQMRHAIVRACVGLAVLVVVMSVIRQREALAGGTMY